MKVLLSSDVPRLSGHYPGHVSGLAWALLDLGVEVVVAAPVAPAELARLGVEHFLIEKPPSLRHVRAGRLFTRRILSIRDRVKADVMWDLDYDRTPLRFTTGLMLAEPRLHSIHSTGFLCSGQTGCARQVRSVVSRLATRALAARGRMIAYSPRDARRLSRICSPESLVETGWPIAFDPAVSLDRTLRRCEVLFVGAARPDKGLRQLVNALAGLVGLSLRLVGPVRSDLAETLSGLDPARVTICGQGSDRELREAYARAFAAVLPYTAGFSRRGGTSAVFVEALAHGCPVVATRHLLECAFGGPFRGVLWADSEDPVHLRSALRELMTRREELALEASEAAPLLRRNHSYDVYVRRALGSLARPGQGKPRGDGKDPKRG